MSRLLEVYNNSIKTELKSKLNLNNLHEVPKLTKIVVNMGIGEGKDDSKLIDKAQEDLSLITLPNGEIGWISQSDIEEM